MGEQCAVACECMCPCIPVLYIYKGIMWFCVLILSLQIKENQIQKWVLCSAVRTSPWMSHKWENQKLPFRMIYFSLKAIIVICSLTSSAVLAALRQTFWGQVVFLVEKDSLFSEPVWHSMFGDKKDVVLLLYISAPL